jgi:iron complex transport system substrate-binding protein
VRIVSLVPSATEMLFALGAGGEVIAVTHECDYPPAVDHLPRITKDVLPAGLNAAEIDAAVRERTERGESIYELDADALVELRPDLIVTQALCAVCAVSFDDVRAIAKRIDPEPIVVSLDPSTLGEVVGDVGKLAVATDHRDEGAELVREAASRIDRVRLAVRATTRPRVAALEWLDPPYVAGSRPEVVVVMPCGYDTARAREEAERYRERLDALGAERVIAVDAAAYFSRPGPRLVDGLELLAWLLHPDRFPEAPAAADAHALQLA